MSDTTSPSEPPDRGQWAPPSGWSPDQPPAWGAPPPQGRQSQGPGTADPGQPPPGYGQAPPPGYGHPGGQQGSPPNGWGQPVRWGAVPQAPKPGIVPLRPLGVGELLDGALSLIRSNPRTVLGLAAAVSAVSALIQTAGLLVSLRYLDIAQTSAGTVDEVDVTVELTALAAGGLAQVVPAIVAGLLQVLASGLFIVLVGAAVLGRRLDAQQTWRILKPRLLALIGVSLIVGLGPFVAGLLLLAAAVALAAALSVAVGAWAILPGLGVGLVGAGALVYAYVRLALASPAVVIEGTGVLRALRRSWVLVHGSWWRVCGILVLAFIITSILTGVVTVPIYGVAAVAGAVSESVVPTVMASGLATLVAGIITLPFGAAVTGLLYVDLRMRREALDIELVSAGVHPAADPLAPYQPPH